MSTKEGRTAAPSGDKGSAGKPAEKPTDKGGNGHGGDGKAVAAKAPDKAPGDKSKTPPSGVPTAAAEAKPEPKVDSRPEPKVDSRPEPKVEARPEPKVEARPEPKVEARPEPEVEARPEPAPAPSPQPAAAAATDAVDVTVLPSPDELPAGDPDAPAPPPGVAPDGDARSLRRNRPGSPALFALVYRAGDALVVNRGEVGRRGTWRSVSYPSVAAASRAYAQTCSELTSEGFTDFHR